LGRCNRLNPTPGDDHFQLPLFLFGFDDFMRLPRHMRRGSSCHSGYIAVCGVSLAFWKADRSLQPNQFRCRPIDDYMFSESVDHAKLTSISERAIGP
jgi:hypothetical protein